MESDVLQQILSKLTSIEVDIKDLKQGQAKLEQGQAKLEQGQAKLEQGQAELTSLVHGVTQHQNEDYALLQAVNDKVTSLASISETHEQKFQKLKML